MTFCLWNIIKTSYPLWPWVFFTRGRDFFLRGRVFQKSRWLFLLKDAHDVSHDVSKLNVMRNPLKLSCFWRIWRYDVLFRQKSEVAFVRFCAKKISKSTANLNKSRIFAQRFTFKAIRIVFGGLYRMTVFFVFVSGQVSFTQGRDF